MPPATMTLLSPARIIWSAIWIARMLDAHTLLMVSEGTSTGSPAPTAACLAGACPTPPWSTWPIVTYSTSSSGTPARSSAARIAIAPSWGASYSFSPPPSFPNGVLTAETMTARAMEGAYLSGSCLLPRLPGTRHLDPLQPGRMRFHEHVRPRRRAGIGVRRVGELLEEALGVPGVLRERERHPVGLGLHVARDHVEHRRGENRKDDQREQAERHGLWVPHPAAPPRHPRDYEGTRDGEERVPADALPEVLARVMPELVGNDDLLLVQREGRAQNGAPEDDPAGGAEADCLCVRQGRLAAHVLHLDRDVVEPELLLVGARGCGEGGPVKRFLAGNQVREDEGEEKRQPDEGETPREPPPVADDLREPDHDQHGEADEEELAPEAEPAAHDPLAVGSVRDVVAPLPPELGQPER